MNSNSNTNSKTNKTGYYPGSDIHNNVSQFLEKHLKESPDLIPLRWVKPGALKTWSFKLGDVLPHEHIRIDAFVEQIGKVAQGYQEIGISKGDRVILFVPMTLELYTSMFALQRIGAIPVFLDSWARRSHLGVSADVVQPRAMVSFEKAFELCSDVPELTRVPIKVCVWPSSNSQIKYTAHHSELLKTSKTAPITAVEQEETALITFTTGSSGKPKGANRTHRFLAAQHYALNECLPYTASDVDLPVFPIFSLNNIASGVSTVIPAFDIGVPGDHDPMVLLAQLRSTNATCTTLSPSLFNRLASFCQEKGVKLDQLRRAVTGGAPVSRDNLVDFKSVATKADIWVLFGSTEVEPMAHIEADEMINMKTRAASDSEWVDDGVNVGKMSDGLKYRFLKIIKTPIEIDPAQAKKDWDRILVPKGEVGELIVAGEHVCRNYYNDEEAFKRAKILDENGEVWHRTGDLGRVDDEGYLWIVGRVHNAIERAGKYCFPVRAEMVLRKLPQTALCAYLGVPNKDLGEKTICVIVPTQVELMNDPKAVTLWKKDVERIMSKNGLPVDQIIYRKDIPMDPRHHSKVEYDILRQQLQSEGLL